MGSPYKFKRSNVIIYLSIVLVLCALSVSAVSAESTELESLDGSGTADDPYVITNVEELQAMKYDLEAQYILNNDINASETKAWNDGAGFEPIGDRDNYFTGVLDGNNKSIENLHIKRVGDRYVGLISIAEGEIFDIHLDDVDVLGDRTTGSVTGYNLGTMKNASATGTVEGGRTVGGISGGGSAERSFANVTVIGEERVGGLLGYSSEPIVHSYSKSDVSGEYRVGGLVGSLSGGGETQLRNSYSMGPVRGEDNVGGLVGTAIWGPPIVDSFTTSPVTGDENVGGLVGYENDQNFQEISAANLYWDEDATGQSIGVGREADPDTPSIGTALSGDDLIGHAAKSNLDGFDFDSFWTTTDERPVLNWQVRDVHLSLSQPDIGAGESTPITVSVTLDDGTTLPATEVADYEVAESAIATVEDGYLHAHNLGSTTLTATVADEKHTVSVDVLEPPEISLGDVELEAHAVVNGTPIHATATYRNDGGPGTVTGTVELDGNPVTAGQLRLDEHTENEITIDYTPDTTGTYDASLDGHPIGTVDVLEAGTVDLDTVDAPSTIGRETIYQLTVDLESTASTPVAETLTYRVDGERVSQDTHVVDPDGSTITLEHTIDDHDNPADTEGDTDRVHPF